MGVAAGAGVHKRRRTTRFIPKSPDKILDAPDLVRRLSCSSPGRDAKPYRMPVC